MKESRHIWPSYMKRIKRHCSIKHDMITTFSLQFPSLEKDSGLFKHLQKLQNKYINSKIFNHLSSIAVHKNL